MIVAKAKPRRADGVSRASVSREYLAAHRQLYGKPRADYLPDNWRSRLPDPVAYYPRHVHKLGKPNATGWGQGKCPFHDDREASLSVHLSGERGGWKCFAGCGHGDLVNFHQRLSGLPFKAAVRDLLGLPT